MSLFSLEKDPLIEELKRSLKTIDVDKLSPLEALQKIHEWKKKLLKDE